MKLGERLKSFIKNNRANFPGEKNYNEAKIVKCIASFACIEKHRNSSSRNRPFFHDVVILILRPECFSFFLSYLNLEIPARFK